MSETLPSTPSAPPFSLHPDGATTALDPASLHWPNRYAALGPAFAHPQLGDALPNPQWVATSDSAAQALGWPADWWRAPGALQAFSAGEPWPGMRPAATVYSGHQFGVWAGQLGDGRALLLGEVATPEGGQGSLEVQLKGSGMTPFSRRADGRAVLRSSIREFLCSEAMHALGIPTTRALALIASPLPVRREGMETAAVVTRLAPSFIRFGHFEHFCHHDRHDELRRLLAHVIEQHAPECAEAEFPAAALLAKVTRQTAELMADWQAVGFCHGVMNTDNMSLLGLTLDYGPFGFLDAFDPGHICNHSDHEGRYAYAQQPQVAYWNLHALAQALVPLIGQGTEPLQDALLPYRQVFARAMSQRMRAKLGLATEQPGDGELADDLLRLMAQDRADYSITFRRLARFTATDNHGMGDLFIDRAGFDAWAERYRARLQLESSVDTERADRMNRVNPKFVLRNHLAEAAIRQANAGDFSEVNRLINVLSHPFDEQPENAADADFPPDWAGSLAVSCSS